MNKICCCFSWSEGTAKSFSINFIASFETARKAIYNMMDLQEVTKVLGERRVSSWNDNNRKAEIENVVNCLKDNGYLLSFGASLLVVAIVTAIIGLKIFAVVSLIVSIGSLLLFKRKINCVMEKFDEQILIQRIDTLKEIALKSGNAAAQPS